MSINYHFARRPNRGPFWLLFFLSFWLPRVVGAEQTTSSSAKSQTPAAIDFNSQIRPILTRYCTSCHGGVKAAGGVSFIYGDQVLPPDGWVIEPGDADASELLQRIISDDPDMRMPPPEEHPDPVPPHEVESIRRWIAEGAKWDPIWSITPLRDPVAKAKSDRTSRLETTWVRQPLDAIVADRLAALDVNPSEEADTAAWLRRVSFDLIGLPPTPAETSVFMKRSEAAGDVQQREAVYAAEVDRLLASPRMGERWASVWMDLARYADSQGFEKDPHRDMWPYRDWLIDAFNSDMPYDEFTIAQLAGDLLDDANVEDLIATAFHRNTMTNTEGGTDDEEFRIAAVIDRVNTTWTVWQAITMGCVQCHSHPYDALEHEDYYASYALFNNTLDADLPADDPVLIVPRDASQKQQAADAFTEVKRNQQRRNRIGSDRIEQTMWTSMTPNSIETSGGKMAINGQQVDTVGGTFPDGVVYDVELSVGEPTITALKIDIKPLMPDPENWPEQGSVLTHLEASLIMAGSEPQPIELADVFVDSLVANGDPREALKGSHQGVGEYPKLTGPRYAVFVLKTPLEVPADARLRLSMTHDADTSGGIATPIRRFVWSSTPDLHWTDLLNSPELADATGELDRSAASYKAIKGVALPVMQSRPEEAARLTHQFIRGNWLEKGDVIVPSIPAMFATDSDQTAPSIGNRLDFARWLVSADNPLAARVWANRIWAQLFGIGIVETLEDFGSSGTLPSDTRLLDHLAVRVRDKHQWHLKPMLREIVLSATYRQCNQADAERISHDPQNRWLARGPRTRLTAEMVRDQALAVSGLLSDQIGGPSVMPPQPDGIWQAVYSGAKWETAEGDQRYRRAIYTYWRRTSPYPSFLMFDSPTRDLCTARRISTNTPLQALVTLNDPVYVECSEELARIAIQQSTVDGKPSAADVIRSMALTITQSPPTELELSELVNLYEDLYGTTHLTEEEAAATRPSHGQKVTDRSDDGSASLDQAAMGIVANTLLNWDKALTK